MTGKCIDCKNADTSDGTCKRVLWTASIVADPEACEAIRDLELLLSNLLTGLGREGTCPLWEKVEELDK